MHRGLTACLLFAALYGRAWPADDPSALALVEHGTVEMRADPDASKQDAEQALALIRQHPDTDLEIRARLLLCDYYSERDGGAAQEQINAATANGEFPIILLGTVLISMMVVTTNRLVWRPLYRLAETRYKLG